MIRNLKAATLIPLAVLVVDLGGPFKGDEFKEGARIGIEVS
jgi:hypothetical protein